MRPVGYTPPNGIYYIFQLHIFAYFPHLNWFNPFLMAITIQLNMLDKIYRKMSLASSVIFFHIISWKNFNSFYLQNPEKFPQLSMYHWAGHMTVKK